MAKFKKVNRDEQLGTEYWIDHGFTKQEATNFQHIYGDSIEDYKHLKTMIESRVRFRNRMKRKGIDQDSIEYEERVKKLYRQRGISDNIDKYNFDLIHSYSSKYVPVDANGKAVHDTPRHSNANKQPTGEKIKNKSIRKYEDQIETLKIKLKLARTNPDKESIREQMNRIYLKIEELKGNDIK